jgi:hypothetical protein
MPRGAHASWGPAPATQFLGACPGNSIRVMQSAVVVSATCRLCQQHCVTHAPTQHSNQPLLQHLLCIHHTCVSCRHSLASGSQSTTPTRLSNPKCRKQRAVRTAIWALYRPLRNAPCCHPQAPTRRTRIVCVCWVAAVRRLRAPPEAHRNCDEAGADAPRRPTPRPPGTRHRELVSTASPALTAWARAACCTSRPRSR